MLCGLSVRSDCWHTKRGSTGDSEPLLILPCAVAERAGARGSVRVIVLYRFVAVPVFGFEGLGLGADDVGFFERLDFRDAAEGVGVFERVVAGAGRLVVAVGIPVMVDVVAMLTFVVVGVGSLMVLIVLKLRSVNSLAAKFGLWIDCPSELVVVAIGATALVVVNGAKMLGLR